ncbi:MAG TPA: ABC transporter ATP-binding protein [Steroidobacteraceae bacterium]|nr:ABC transporter ATP-binding protein [Steroidobacteraceae bacterium]
MSVPVAAARANGQGAPYVRIERVRKDFGSFVAVNEVSLEIYRGEVFCLLGGSGSGKTTLLRMLAGLETPTSGRVYIDDQDMTTIPPYRRPVNMMFQSYALFPHMSVEKNVAFGLEQEGLDRREIRTRVAEILEIVKMGAYGARKPHQLSGGQRQRVALARALVKRPKLLLLDEPLAALDRKLREHTQFELLNIQKRLGVTFVVVTHDQQEAMTISTRMGVMDRGEIVQVGTPAEIYETPATRFVADFIGSVNLLEGEVVRTDSAGLSIRCSETGAQVEVAEDVGVAPGGRVWVALRPEKIELAREPAAGSPAAANQLRGIVKEIGYRGDASAYLVELASGRVFRVTRPNIARDTELRIARDDAVLLSWHRSSPIVLRQ